MTHLDHQSNLNKKLLQNKAVTRMRRWNNAISQRTRLNLVRSLNPTGAQTLAAQHI